jgi:hypothetical protein
MGSVSSPVGLFALLGQTDRMAILRALVAVDAATAERRLTFTGLKRRAGIDDTGRFNYHLGKLVGTLVAKTDEGYRLSKFGRRLLRPMTTGYYDPESTVSEIRLPGECSRCGASLRVRLHENVLQVVCTADHVVNYGLVASPGLVVEHPPAEATTALGLLTTHAVELGTTGVCPTCHGRVDGEIVPFEVRDRGDSTDDGRGGVVEDPDDADCHVFRAPCETCGNRFTTPVGGCVTTHPRVVQLYAARDVDVRRTVPWTHPFRHAGAAEVVSHDPFRIGLVVGAELSGESLYLTLDGTGSVRSLQRLPP